MLQQNELFGLLRTSGDIIQKHGGGKGMRGKGLREWAKQIHQSAVKYGWWHGSPLCEIVLMCLGFLREADNEYGAASKPRLFYHYCKYDGHKAMCPDKPGNKEPLIP